jgi:hypothetical protein
VVLARAYLGTNAQNGPTAHTSIDSGRDGIVPRKLLTYVETERTRRLP